MNENTDIRDLMIQIEKARKQLMQPFLQNLGLTLGQGHARILNCLLEEDHLTQKELARRCRMDTTTMSRSLDKLAEEGYLVRERDPDCRRSFLICLTDTGRQEAAQVHQGFDHLNDIICEGMEPEKRELLKKNLERILKNLKECPGL